MSQIQELNFDEVEQVDGGLYALVTANGWWYLFNNSGVATLFTYRGARDKLMGNEFGPIMPGKYEGF